MTIYLKRVCIDIRYKPFLRYLFIFPLGNVNYCVSRGKTCFLYILLSFFLFMYMSCMAVKNFSSFHNGF